MKNCSLCVTEDCEFVGVSADNAEWCKLYNPKSESISELDELRNQIADLALDLQELREAFNRILCAVRKEIQ